MCKIHFARLLPISPRRSPNIFSLRPLHSLRLATVRFDFLLTPARLLPIIFPGHMTWGGDVVELGSSLTWAGARSQESGVGSQSQESGVRSQEPEVRSQKSGVRSQKLSASCPNSQRDRHDWTRRSRSQTFWLSTCCGLGQSAFPATVNTLTGVKTGQGRSN